MCCHDQANYHHGHGSHPWNYEQGHCCAGHHDAPHGRLPRQEGSSCHEEGHTPMRHPHTTHFSPFWARPLSKEALVEELKARRSSLKEALGYVEEILTHLEKKAPDQEPPLTEA